MFHVKQSKLTPAWLAHRKGLSDTPPTSTKTRAMHRLRMRAAEESFHKWHKECQRRKERREVLAAKGLMPKAANNSRGKDAAPRSPRSRIRCP